MSKNRADVFFRLKPGEFICFADGKDKRVQFRLQQIQKKLPQITSEFSKDDFRLNFEKIHREAKSIFNTTKK